MTFWEFLTSYGSLFASGLQMTLFLVAFSAIGTAIVAVSMGLLRLSGVSALNALAVIYIEFFRGSSLLVQIYWIYFVLPLFGVTLEPLVAGVLALSLNLGAYGAEIVRGAVLAVPKGQWEAATALNFTPQHRMHRIIAPQAIAILLPAWGNLMIDVLKASALVSLISVVDLMFVARQINGQTFLSAQAFGTALIGYYIFARFLITPGLRSLEKRYARKMGGTRV